MCFFRFDVWKGLNFSFISIYIEFCVACLCVQSSDQEALKVVFEKSKEEVYFK